MKTDIDKMKDTIVDGCKRGVCTSDGGWVPYNKRNPAGKGSHFIGKINNKKNYDENYERIFRKNKNSKLKKVI